MSCTICGRATDPKYRPFCSRRCADVDLGRWLAGSYAIPAEEPQDELEADRGSHDPEGADRHRESAARPLDKPGRPV